MRRLRYWNGLAAIAACVCAIPIDTNPAIAQDPDSLAINGTFIMSPFWGTVDPDLAAIAAKGDTYTWTMTLHGLSYEYDYEDFSSDPNDVYVRYVTRIRATSFEFAFQGPDADELNAIVGSEWITNGSQYGAMLELRHVILTNYDWGGLEDAGDWVLQISKPDWGPGIHFVSLPAALEAPFAVDADGYPILAPFVSVDAWASLTDNRPGYDGTIGQDERNMVAVGGPLPPPPPPSPPTLSIADAAVREGNRGTTWLDLTVSLSRYPDDVVMVDYHTVDGTANSKSDYTATSGTLLFWPDEISHVISIAIKTDRKREQDETFTVRLLNAAGATIADGVATATILNDD